MEFRVFLPILPDKYANSDIAIAYPLTMANYLNSSLPDPMRGSNIWEFRVDTYISVGASFIGLKRRGSNEKVLELKIRKPESSGLHWLECWTKYKIKSSRLSLQNDNSSLKECLIAEGYQHLLAKIEPKISAALSHSISVRKSRKNIRCGNVTLEMCLIGTDIAPSGSSDPQWISYAIEAENPSDILAFLSDLGTKSAGDIPSPWDCVLNLLDLIRQEKVKDLPIPILSGYPMWLQYISADVEKQGLVDEAMNRLSSFESFMNSCKTSKLAS